MKPVRTIWAAKMEAGALDLYLYDDIVPDGEDWWTGEPIPSATSASTVQQMIQDAGNIAAINVYINSYGGDVKEGIGIYSLLVRSKAYVTAYIDGFACSVASVIAMAADKVVMGSNTLMMVHNASAGAFGTSADLRKAADDLDVINSQAIKSYQDKAGDKLPPETLQQLLDNETWLTAEQCIQYGLADEIAAKEPTPQETATQRLAQARAALVAQMSAEHTPKVPEKFSNQKTNAERLMAAFKNKTEVK
jgi:Protease subunit of ATP-dependent Clp proteases